MEDIGLSVHYTAVPSGVPVYGSDGAEVGRVVRTLDNYREHIFDGLVFKSLDGRTLFADAPEVERTAERGVVLALTAEEAQRLGPPEKGAGRAGGGLLGRLFGRR